MKIRVVRMLFVAIFPALVATGCAVAAASQPAPIAVGHVGSAEAVAQAAAPLAECQRPDAVLGATPTATAVDRGQAETAAGAIGVRGRADIALLTTVTLGPVGGSVPTAANALRDGNGLPIVARPAWVMVFRNQSVRTPTGYWPGALSRPAPPQTVLAAIVDAQSGTFLRGWGCDRGSTR